MKKDKHKYLLNRYHFVNDNLSLIEKGNTDLLPDIIVAFCLVVEKSIKIKLYNKNTFLVFSTSEIKEDNIITISCENKGCHVIKNINLNIALDRIKKIFPEIFSDTEIEAIQSIYEIRNALIHSHHTDDKFLDSNLSNVSIKIGKVWNSVSLLMKDILGDTVDGSQYDKLYTKEDLEDVLNREVKQMIDSNYNNGFGDSLLGQSYINPTLSYNHIPSMMVSGIEEKCPRCGYMTFSTRDSYIRGDVFSISTLDLEKPVLYECSNCHLGLTKNQYERAKKIERQKS